ncbi:MAG: type II toxin-antitoxin system Phd/YefM family antitoxin [Acidobacteriaceae bacterium]
MPITTVTSREFNQNVSRARKAAGKGPVFITDRGHPAQVLLSIEEYRKITGKHESIVDLLSDPKTADIDFNPPRLTRLHRSADLS